MFVAVAILLVALALPASAAADGRERVGTIGWTTEALAGPRPADGQLWSATTLAQEWWASRGYDSCALIVPAFAAVPDGAPDHDGLIDKVTAEGWSVLGSCSFALTARFAAKTRMRRGWWSYVDLRYECAIVVHETGHALGLTHEDADRFPVMAQGIWDAAIPGRCRTWARDAVRVMRPRRASSWQPKARGS